MKASIQEKLQRLAARREEINKLLADPDTIADQAQFRALSMEHAQLNPVVNCFIDYQAALDDIAAAEAMLKDGDRSIRELAGEELGVAEDKRAALELELQRLLLPRDPHDDSNVYLEIRAGTGGDEAALFAGDLFRMYSRYAENRSWAIEIISEQPGEHGGYKEIITRVLISL